MYNLKEHYEEEKVNMKSGYLINHEHELRVLLHRKSSLVEAAMMNRTQRGGDANPSVSLIHSVYVSRGSAAFGCPFLSYLLVDI